MLGCAALSLPCWWTVVCAFNHVCLCGDVYVDYRLLEISDIVLSDMIVKMTRKADA